MIGIPISVKRLNGLLFALKGDQSAALLRVRLLSKTWGLGFCKLIEIRGKKLILVDQTNNNVLTIDNFEYIVQFELSKAYLDLEPYVHYKVVFGERSADTEGETNPSDDREMILHRPSK